MATFFTIGHSTRSLAEFIALLKTHGVTHLVDVRRLPGSRTNPQFNAENLSPALGLAGIGYTHLPALGGRRGRIPGGGASENLFWDNPSFRNYADYAATDAFRAGFESLRQLGRDECCAIMCAEAVWWRCHRRIIADYLIAAGDTVFHVMGPGKVEPARLTAAAQSLPNGALKYPKAALQ